MLKNILKFILSIIIAIIILTLFCMFYYNTPVHLDNIDNTTDYQWESKAFYSRGTEGFAMGKTNNEGYMNMFDYYENDKIDILIMGSSHMEAFQVPMNESTAGILNSMLKDDTVYNIGISGHNFLICASHLKNALQKYKPSKYVIIETSTINFNENDLSQIINNGSLKKLASYSNGLIGFLQRNQFLRLAYTQYKSFRYGTNNDTEVDTSSNTFNIELTNNLLNKMQNIVADAKTKLIILYHPSTILNENGEIVLSQNTDDVDKFNELCNNNNIIFVNMSERFVNEYNENYILPYGFINTSVGSGHLNKYGHKMIAEELYEVIEEEE